MKRLLFAALLSGLVTSLSAATTNISPWTPLFEGIDYSMARVISQGQPGDKNLVINCLRIDLTSPDIRLFTTPKCTNCNNYETLAENNALFLERYGVQVAINGMFYQSSTGPNDVPVGTPENIFGLSITEGQLVSPQDVSTHAATFMFSSNNVPSFFARNWPATADTNGIYTAFTGNILLVTNGLNAGTNVMDNDPRTAVGVSEENRYLFLMTIDGRQSSWSVGANFYETADWLIRFGAFNGFAVDGGGSTTMNMADCTGKAVPLNRSSYVFTYGRERRIGHNIGVYARPLGSQIKDLVIEPGTTTAILTWRTDLPATTQVEWGATTNYGDATPLDSRLVKTHIATIAGLTPGSNYHFRALSGTGTEIYAQGCQFATLGGISRTRVFDITNSWKFTTNSLDGVPWTTPGYNDSGWMGEGPGLLYAETSTSVSPKNTPLPPGQLASGSPFPRTYYFRTRFNAAGVSSGTTLVFSNYIDDGAVFYLNGVEISRLRMPAAPTVISYGTEATGSPTNGDATTADVFPVSGAAAGNLLDGENVLAVEVHNRTPSADAVFGSALFIDRPLTSAPRLNIAFADNEATLYWNGSGFTLQQTADLGSETNALNWVDVPGPVTNSPVVIGNAGSIFYRLRN